MGAVHHADPIDLGGWNAVALMSADERMRAIVVPELGMLTWSLAFDGEEYLGQPNAIGAFAAHWATTGIPLLHPWANRLGAATLAGVDRPTISESPLIPRDDNGLAIHGINLAGAGWRVTDRGADATAVWVESTLVFDDDERLAIFPFPHSLCVRVTLATHTLTIATRLTPSGDTAVPVSFGWHPYLHLPGIPRRDWVVALPVARRAELGPRMLPTGRTETLTIPPGPLGATIYDDLFTELTGSRPVFSLSGGGKAVHVRFGEGYRFAQVYAPGDRDVIAFEPMTALTNALVTRAGVRWVTPGQHFDAAFCVTIASRD